MGAFKWIGGAVGWATGGVIGGILGYFFGSMIEGAVNIGKDSTSDDFTKSNYRYRSQNQYGSGTRTQEGDFGMSLLVLSAAIMKSDNRILRSELDFIKDFYKRQFGQQKAENYIHVLRELLKKDIDVLGVCRQIRTYMDYSSRLQLLHYMFGLANSDNEVNRQEVDLIAYISNELGINSADYNSVKAMFVKETESAYKILEITSNATDSEVHSAYKKMAMKYHPDRVAHLGEDVQKAANEKFKKVNEAFESIKKSRGMK